MAKAPNETEARIAISNRKARFDYEILDVYEAGIVLKGSEVKSLRLGNANLLDSYAALSKGEVWLHHMHISPFKEANQFNHDPVRTRKLLLNRSEIRKLVGKTTEKGLTLVPLKVYFKNGHAKVELALARGKRDYDRRQDIKKRDAERELRRTVR
ncbi:MAG: SsrA-binding protein SmpB [Bacteroidetes bacterium]|nr:MAG: SsrA-binding protein SmpB [Bacteroidota bacterium]